MKLKHYLGALFMAGSMVAISLPADANPVLRSCQNFCKRFAPPLVKRLAPPLAKSIEKTISKPGITRAIGLIPRSQTQLINAELIKAKQITDKIIIGAKVPPSIPTPNNTSQLPGASSHPVVSTPVTGTEPESQFRVVRVAGGIIIVVGGTTVYLNLPNANSEKPQNRVSEVRTSGADKSQPIFLRKLIR
jgi:hypothetical protein